MLCVDTKVPVIAISSIIEDALLNKLVHDLLDRARCEPRKTHDLAKVKLPVGFHEELGEDRTPGARTYDCAYCHDCMV